MKVIFMQVKLGTASTSVGSALIGWREGTLQSLHRTAASVNTTWLTAHVSLSLKLTTKFKRLII